MCVQKAGFWNYEMSWRTRVKAVRKDEMERSYISMIKQLVPAMSAMICRVLCSTQ